MADQNPKASEVVGTTHLLNPSKSESVIQGRAVVAYMEGVTSKRRLTKNSLEDDINERDRQIEELNTAKDRSIVQKASTALASMKAYMKQSEKLYRHKAEQLTIKKTPLELANDQITALEVKIKRRDHLITELRKNLAVELLQLKTGSIDDFKNRLLIKSNSEDIKILELQEEIIALNIKVTEKDNEISKLKTRLDKEIQKVIHTYGQVDELEIVFKEALQKVESNNIVLAQDILAKEDVVVKLTNEITNLNAQIKKFKSEEIGFKEVENSLLKDIKLCNNQISTLKNSIKNSNELESKISDLNIINIKLTNEISTLKTEINLSQKKYEKLVQDLDDLVASKAFVKPESSVTSHDNKNVIPAPARRTAKAGRLTRRLPPKPIDINRAIMLTMSKNKLNENDSDSDSDSKENDADESVLPSKIISNLKLNTAQESRNKHSDTRLKNQYKNDEGNHQDVIYKLKSQHNEELENYKYKESMYKKSAEKLEESILHLENKILEITKDNNEIKKAKDIEISSLKSICQDSSLEISALMSRIKEQQGIIERMKINDESPKVTSKSNTSTKISVSQDHSQKSSIYSQKSVPLYDESQKGLSNLSPSAKISISQDHTQTSSACTQTLIVPLNDAIAQCDLISASKDKEASLSAEIDHFKVANKKISSELFETKSSLGKSKKFMHTMLTTFQNLSKKHVPFKNFNTIDKTDCLDDQVRLNYATVKKLTTPNLLYQKRILSTPEQGPSDDDMKSRLKRSLKYIEDAMLLHSKLMKEFKNKDPSSNDNLSSRKSNQKDVMTSVLYTFNIILLTIKHFLTPNGKSSDPAYPELLSSLLLPQEEVMDDSEDESTIKSPQNCENVFMTTSEIRPSSRGIIKGLNDSRAIRAGSRDVKSSNQSNNYELNSNAKIRNNKNIDSNSMEIEIDTSSEKYKHSLYEDVMHGGLRVGSLVVEETPNNTLMVKKATINNMKYYLMTEDEIKEASDNEYKTRSASPSSTSATARLPHSSGGRSLYSEVMEMHPQNPQIKFMGDKINNDNEWIVPDYLSNVEKAPKKQVLYTAPEPPTSLPPSSSSHRSVTFALTMASANIASNIPPGSAPSSGKRFKSNSPLKGLSMLRARTASPNSERISFDSDSPLENDILSIAQLKPHIQSAKNESEKNNSMYQSFDEFMRSPSLEALSPRYMYPTINEGSREDSSQISYNYEDRDDDLSIQGRQAKARAKESVTGSILYM